MSVLVQEFPTINGKNNAQKLLEQADLALYKAKQMGRNQVVVFNQMH
ncbi:hypothetical protein [Legionella sp.]